METHRSPIAYRTPNPCTEIRNPALQSNDRRLGTDNFEPDHRDANLQICAALLIEAQRSGRDLLCKGSESKRRKSECSPEAPEGPRSPRIACFQESNSIFGEKRRSTTCVGRKNVESTTMTLPKRHGCGTSKKSAGRVKRPSGLRGEEAGTRRDNRLQTTRSVNNTKADCGRG